MGKSQVFTVLGSIGCTYAGGFYCTGISAASFAGWTVTASALAYIISSILAEDRPPKLYYKETPLSRYIVKHCRILTQPFRPPYWARNTHVQTCLPMILPRASFEFKREVMPLSDGGILTLDYGIPGVDSLKPDAPILLAIPGLNGDSGYVLYLCKEAVLRGFRPIVFNKRGLAGSSITTPKLQSFGDPTDLREVMLFLRKSYPDALITSVGVSAGSGLLASYLGEYGSSCYIEAAVCNCPGYILKLFEVLMQPYNYVMTQGLKQMLRRHKEILSKAIDVDAALNAKLAIDFERLVYSKIYKYESFEEYLKDNEPGRALENSVPPVLCINSSDDPICLEKFFPYHVFRDLPNGMLAVTAEGGHCGFVERWTWNRWADDVALDYIETALEFNKTMKQKVDE